MSLAPRCMFMMLSPSKFNTRNLHLLFLKHTKFFYAAKALTNINILKYVKNLGASLDCVSINEVKLGLKAGFPKERFFSRQTV
jgi:diaminopimelate decarboxylase